MNKKIRIDQAITYIVVGIAIVLFLCTWPLGILQRHTVSKSEEKVSAESGVCNDEHIIAQVFVSEGTELKSADVYVCNDISGKDITLTLFDATLTQIYSKTMGVDDKWTSPGFVHIPMRLDVERGGAYILSVSGGEEDLIVGLEDHLTTTNPSVFAITYDGEEDPYHNMLVRYNYGIDFVWWQIVLIDLLIALLTVGIVMLVRLVFKNKPCDRELKVQALIQCIFNPIVVIITAILLWLVYPSMIFSDKLVNILFWDLGIILFALLLLYEINYKRAGLPNAGLLQYVKENIQNWIIAVAIGHVLWYCFEYMNGLYEIHHSYASRRILIWIAITLIATFTKKELINFFNIIWMIVGIPVAYFYAKTYVGMGEEELLYNLNGKVLYFGGFIVINLVLTIISLIKKERKIKRLNFAFLVPTVIFLVGICSLANTRWWPGYMTLVFVLFTFRIGVWDKADTWIMNVCDGILVNFIMMLVFSLLHRPYYGYIYHRYDMCYMTVTMTATHLTLSLAAAGVKLYAKSRECSDKRQLLSWLILFGTVANYMIFTLSRTGYMAVIVMVIVAVSITCALWESKGMRIYKGFASILTLLCATLVMFPIVFGMTRILPAINDDPVIYEYEPCMVTIYKGDAPNQEYYMDLPRFIDVFASKVLGIGDATVSVDEEIPKYEYSIYKSEFLYASANADDEDELKEALKEQDEFSNGRIDIYKSYVAQSNLWGHETMGAILDDGEEAAHAHSIYLQVVFDHGLIFGIYFVLFLIYLWIVCVKRLKRETDSTGYSILTIVILTGFMVAGLVEWIFHACNPFTMGLVMALVPFVYKNGCNIEVS